MANSRPQQAKAARPRSGRRPLATPDAPRGQGAFPIVGIGASAGGLEACRTLLGALAPGNGMAFILVQHLDPTHESMMVDLLAGHTSMIRRDPVGVVGSIAPWNYPLMMGAWKIAPAIAAGNSLDGKMASL